jgi:hypothetical protein
MALFPYTPITQRFKLHENNDIKGDNICLSAGGLIELCVCVHYVESSSVLSRHFRGTAGRYFIHVIRDCI